MHGKHTSHDIFIDVRTKGLIDLLRNSRTTEPGVMAFHFNDGMDKFRGRALRPRYAFATGSI